MGKRSCLCVGTVTGDYGENVTCHCVRTMTGDYGETVMSLCRDSGR